MGGQWPRTMRARLGVCRYTIGYRSVSFYSTVGAGNAGRQGRQPMRARRVCNRYTIGHRSVSFFGTGGGVMQGGQSPHARHGRFPSSPQLNCAYSTGGQSPPLHYVFPLAPPLGALPKAEGVSSLSQRHSLRLASSPPPSWREACCEKNPAPVGGRTILRFLMRTGLWKRGRRCAPGCRRRSS